MRIIFLMLTFLWSGFALGQQQIYGHAWGQYSEDNLSGSEVVLGVKRKFDEKYSADVSLVTNGVETTLNTANVKAVNLFANDSVTVGLQSQPYVGFIESALGTKWLNPTFAEASKLLPARDAGASYAVNFSSFGLGVHARNDRFGDKHHTYGVLAGYDINESFKALGEVERSAATNDLVYNVAFLAKGSGLNTAFEFARVDFSSGLSKDYSSFGATANYSIPDTKVSVYGQFLTGDDTFKEVSKYDQKIAVGPSIALNDNIKAALVVESANKNGKDKNSVSLKGAVEL